MIDVFDEDATKFQNLYPSRLRGEPIEGVDDVHFTPIDSREARLALVWSI